MESKMGNGKESAGDFHVEKLSDTRSLVTMGERRILIIGTAHVSVESSLEVKEALENERPAHLCIEIDRERLANLDKGNALSGTDLRCVIRNGQGFMMMTQLALGAFQRRIGLGVGSQPGAEMKMAVDVARELDIPFSCCDRRVQITLRRAWRKSGFFDRIKLLSALATSVLSRRTASAAEIEDLKKADAMQSLMEELARALPTVKEVLIDERDFYLASKICQSRGDKIIAVVGAAHAPGIIRLMKDIHEKHKDMDTSPIESVPQSGWYSRLLPWLIPAAIFGLLILGLIRSGPGRVLEMGTTWVLVNGLLSALGAIIALAHPLTVVGSFLAAPVTSLNPTIGVGMVSGLLEYMFRNPRVMDVDSLSQDIITFKGWYRNRISRTLLVIFFSSLGSTVGTFISIGWLSRIAGS